MRQRKYDIIVVGGGHAGIEAAYSAAKLGCRVLLVTLDIDNIGKLSCNPAVGGVAKGHLVKEVDALGGLIARITDQVAVSYRRLNRSRGPAVWSTRVQVDRFRYPRVARKFIEEAGNIEILKAKVENILISKKKVIGVNTNFGQVLYASKVIVCIGTFLNSIIHIGLNHFPGGRLYEESSDKLCDSLKKIGFKIKYFKTGTCARLDKRTIDFSSMEEQYPEYDVEPFSLFSHNTPRKQLSCFITYTNPRTHRIIKKSLNRSPLYTGKIKSTGVRYCPSLEDKIVRFSDRDRHQIFIEPEGFDSIEVYPNGISTSLPFDVQYEFIRSIEGLEKAVILRPGYGIEHGVIDARQLWPTLESKIVKGLYFSGQINGTTGYEEAAAQGVIAGINAALAVKKKESFILRREDGFIGILIDDLTTKGTNEPYRMFTSRCEYKLSLRESNAHFRLGEKSFNLGLISKDEFFQIKRMQERVLKCIKELKKKSIVVENKKITLYDYLKRPQVGFAKVKEDISLKGLTSLEEREVEISAKYEGFIRKEMLWVKEMDKLEKIKLSDNIDYNKIPSLSKEVQEKLNFYKPKNLKEALAISGVTPAAVFNIYLYLNRNRNER